MIQVFSAVPMSYRLQPSNVCFIVGETLYIDA